VEDGSPLDEAIDRHFSSVPVLSSYKPLIYEIAAGVIRRKLYLDWVLSHFVKERLKKDARHLLWMGLYQIFFMKKAAYHVVNETVDYAKAEKGQGMANFVNAVLRRSIREKDRLILPRDPVTRLSVEHSFPRWLVARWYKRFGEEAAGQLLDLQNRSPVFTLRIDAGKITPEDAARRLEDMGVKTEKGRFLKSALSVDKVGPLIGSDLLKNRLVYVQDEASQMAGLAVAPRPGEMVLEACAGQGTKTDQIREEWPETRIVAMDRDGRKLHSVRGTACLVQGDVLKNPFKKGPFDSILLDAPCSSLGIIRKHPEIKWRRNERDIQTFGELQTEMIRSLREALREGGHLIYSVCSFEPEETTGVMDKVIKEGLFEPEPALPMLNKDVCFLSLPHVSGMDGFFIARLKKA
jgi:16S rRNA (cytosine967-C5)-methyltransferase